MGLSDWINRYIVEVKPDPPAPAPAGAGATPGPRLVPTKRTAADLIAELGGDAPAAAPRDGASTDADVEALLAEARTVRPAPAGAPGPRATFVPAGPPDGPPAPRPPAPAPAPAPAPGRAAAAAPAVVEAGDPVDALDDGGDPPARLEQVYAVAKLGKPAHGFGLERIAQMLADPRLAKLDEQARAAAVAVLLEGAGVPIEAVVKDAALRDQALDKFETFLADKLTALEADLEKEDARLEEEVARLIAQRREQQARNQQRLLDKKKELARFRRVKRAEELRLFDVVRHFTAENPISVSGPAAPVAPPPPARAEQAAPDLGVTDTGVFRKPAPDDPYAAMAARLREERERRGGDAP